MSSERPGKRIRQACEPCRRKKTRCPGEKPVCSYCARLRQDCHYSDEERYISSVSPVPRQQPDVDEKMEDRLKAIERQLAEVLANQIPMNNKPSPVHSPRVSLPPLRSSFSSLGATVPAEPSRHPPWEAVIDAAELYLKHCDCQPLPLFYRPNFIQTLRSREPEVLYSLLALASRFGPYEPQAISTYIEAARSINSKKMFEGTIELATLQSLCLLTLVDFTNGNTRQSSIHCSLAMTLAHNAGLTSETQTPFHEQLKEERRRCFWSLFLLKRLHGADFMILDFAAEDNFPWYPQSKHPEHISSSNEQEKGIIAYAIQLSEVWFKITRYASRRGKPNPIPPWSSQSDYSTILAQQMDFETRMPYFHRFQPARFSQQSLENLNSNREYWAPWLFIQFVYHTNLCLLNHPLLLSLRLRNFKCVIPEIFLQHTSDLIASHASWIINFIDMLEAKDFKVTDPFLGHCVAVVGTIYLQDSVVGTRTEKRDAFEKCLRFIRGLGAQWPHMGRIADKLQQLAETVSSTYVASEESTRQNRKLLIDLGQFFEILEYSSSSEISQNQLFGVSLQETIPGIRGEIAQTTVLPEPTRVERQEFRTPHAVPDMAVIPLAYSNDELAVLAESFFNHGSLEGNVNWWNAEMLRSD